jgi:hypothetical protein
VDAQTFIVRDAAGNPRATFGLLVPRDPNDPVAQAAMKGGLPCLMLRDGDGTVRVSVVVGQDGAPSMQFCDRGGRPRATVGLAADGSPSVSLTDPRGAEAVAVSVQGEGDALLEVKRGTRGIALTVADKAEPALLVRDEGKVRFSLLPTGFLLIDENSVRRGGFVVLQDGTAQILFMGPDGKVIAKIPQ